MPLLGSHLAKLAASLQKLLLPFLELGLAVVADRGGAFPGGLLALLHRPWAVLDPAGGLFDQPAVSDRTEHPRQVAMAFGLLLVPGAERAHRLRSLVVEGLDPLDCNVEIAHGTELAVEPFQLVPHFVAHGVMDHR